jgi:hypothetical protein
MSIAGGYTVSKKLCIPNYVSNHMLLSFKWNSFQTPQAYLSCADIVITGSGSGNPPPVVAPPSICTSPVAQLAVTFESKTKTAYVDKVKLVGSFARLGSWNVGKAVTVDAAKYTDANPLWTASVTFACWDCV